MNPDMLGKCLQICLHACLKVSFDACLQVYLHLRLCVCLQAYLKEMNVILSYNEPKHVR